jgi:DNA-binding NarL/FixJ family response regulator
MPERRAAGACSWSKTTAAHAPSSRPACSAARASFWLGSAGTVQEALAWLARTTTIPDVLLVDLGMPDGTGLDVIRDAVARFPGCEPLVVSVFGDEENVLASIEAGAVGYIHKDAAPEDIAQTIVEMKAGASPISPMIARRVLAKYRSLQSAATPVRRGPRGCRRGAPLAACSPRASTRC